MTIHFLENTAKYFHVTPLLTLNHVFFHKKLQHKYVGTGWACVKRETKRVQEKNAQAGDEGQKDLERLVGWVRARGKCEYHGFVNHIQTLLSILDCRDL